MIMIVIMLLCAGCNGKYCIKTNVEKYGIAGEICYDSISSEIEGAIVFEDKEGNQVFGIDEKDIDTIIDLIEKSKGLWDKSKSIFGLERQKRYKKLQLYLEKYKKLK